MINFELKKELAVAALTSVLFGLLILLVVTTAASQRPATPALAEIEPIAIFPDFGAIVMLTLKSNSFLIILKTMLIQKIRI